MHALLAANVGPAELSTLAQPALTDIRDDSASAIARTCAAWQSHFGAEPCSTAPASADDVARAHARLATSALPAGLAPDIAAAFDGYRSRLAAIDHFVVLTCAGMRDRVLVGRDGGPAGRLVPVPLGP
jgi:hypothetical protein